MLRIECRESRVETERPLQATTVTHVREKCGMDQGGGKEVVRDGRIWHMFLR